MIITPYFIKKEIRKLTKEAPGRTHYYRSFDEAGSVLLLFDAKDLKEVEPCIQQLVRMKKRVFACAYAKSDYPDWPPSYLLIREKKDVNLWGLPSREIAGKLQEMRADLLIDLSHPHSYTLRYLMLQLPVPLKTGAKLNDVESPYDLTISLTAGNQIRYIFDQILFYLQAIRSK